MEEIINSYGNEIALGGSGAIGTAVIAIVKRLANRFDKMEKRITKLEADLKINTALDVERTKRKP